MLEGKCFYRVTEWWTYEFCYKSHVRQFHRDPYTQKVTEEYMIGRYNASAPFEVYTAPDRTDHTMELDQDGPAWTTALLTGVCGVFVECASSRRVCVESASSLRRVRPRVRGCASVACV